MDSSLFIHLALELILGKRYSFDVVVAAKGEGAWREKESKNELFLSVVQNFLEVFFVLDSSELLEKELSSSAYSPCVVRAHLLLARIGHGPLYLVSDHVAL